jgi:hypothetical protein
MNPGRELDALVAEKVMGCHNVNGQLYPPDFSGHGIHLAIVAPHYSTSIAAAWKVVEKLENNFVALSALGSGFRVEMKAFVTATVYGEADTAAHAICLAALKAVGL